mmetsp:Transcript_2434/g.5755  ORF Transcript_2434/g.5755 Transcript_2434/m.5755 type:complete len:202 (+) Transcript_2434:231-836(+)
MRRVDLDLYLADPRAGPVDPREDVPLHAFDVDLEHVEVVVAELPHVGRKARGVVGREVATVVSGGPRVRSGATPRRRAHGGAPVEDVDLAARRELEDAPLEEVVPARAERVDDAPLFVGPLRGLHLRQAACPLRAVAQGLALVLAVERPGARVVRREERPAERDGLGPRGAVPIDRAEPPAPVLDLRARVRLEPAGPAEMA